MTITRATIGVVLLTILLLMISAVPVVAQDEVSIELTPVEVANHEVRSVAPTDWSSLGNGAYARGAPPDDLARIVLQAADASPEQLWQILLPSLGLADAPESTGAFRTDGFEWMLYRFDIEPGGVEVSVELAFAENDGRTSIVLFQTAPEEFEILRDGVFVPALEAFAPLEPEVTPHPSTFAYQIEEVGFPGGMEGVELAGTLTRPNGEGPHPVVVLMSGSGAQDRDESLKPLTTLKPFAEIADALTSAGVAVLRYDDRGVDGSTGDYDSSTISDLAGDARAAIDFVASLEDIDASRIGILGHSEGGLYASMLAVEDPRVRFVVLMAPGVVDGVDLLTAQNEAILRVAGESEDDIASQLEFLAAVLPLVRDEDFEGADALSRQFLGELWDRQTPEDKLVLGDRDGFIDRTREQQDAGWERAWLRTILSYDPSLDWRQVEAIPVLGLFGGKDVQVVLDQNEPALRKALEAAGNKDFETVIFPNANHLFQEAETGAVQEYPTLEPAFTDGFLETIVEWVTARTGVVE